MKKFVKIPTKKHGTVTAEITTQSLPNLTGYDGKPNLSSKPFVLFMASCIIKKVTYVASAGSAEGAIKQLRDQIDMHSESLVAGSVQYTDIKQGQHRMIVPSIPPVIKRR